MNCRSLSSAKSSKDKLSNKKHHVLNVMFFNTYEQTCKPSSVSSLLEVDLQLLTSNIQPPVREWQPSILDISCLISPATIPGGLSGQLHLPPIQSCFGWGLPSQPVSRLLVRSYRTVASLPLTGGWMLEVRN